MSSDLEYRIIKGNMFFGFEKHRASNAKDFLKHLIHKGVISVNLLKEVNEEMTDCIAKSIDESATETAEKLNTVYGKLIK